MGGLRIGTRGSALARWQARRVQELLAARAVESELVFIPTSGDRGIGAERPTDAVKALFTKEIEETLLAGDIDVAVHSLKDLALDLPAGLELAAVPEREDPRDALVTRDGADLHGLLAGARVGTSSLRRVAALRAARPDVQPVPLRGNVPTRVRRVEDGTVDGAILAFAGLKRLGLVEHAVPLDPEAFVPAPGQGALALEIRTDDRAVREIITKLDQRDVRTAVEAERAALARLGAGCNVPIGAMCHRIAGRFVLRVTLYVEAKPPTSVRVEVPPDDPQAAGAEAAAQLVQIGIAVGGPRVGSDD